MPYLPGPNSTLQAALSGRLISTVVIETVLDTLIAFAALFGNTLVLFILYKKPSLRTIPNYFIIALALSDVGMALLVTPWSITTLIKGYWVFNFEICQFQGFMSVFLASFSLNILTVMALNRYCRIVKQASHRKYFNACKTKIYVIIAALFGVLAGLPHILAGRIYEFQPGKFFCYQEQVLWSSLYLMIVCIGIPATVIIFCYLKVFLTIRNHKKHFLKTYKQPSFQRITVEDIKVTKTLFATVVAFLVCWMPVFAVGIADLAGGGQALPRQVYVMFTMCATASSAVNPIIYGIMNTSFRKAYINLFKLRGIRTETDVQPAPVSNTKFMWNKNVPENIEEIRSTAVLDK